LIRILSVPAKKLNEIFLDIRCKLKYFREIK